MALPPPSAAGTPTSPATSAPTASTISGNVIGVGDSCGPCQAARGAVGPAAVRILRTVLRLGGPCVTS